MPVVRRADDDGIQIRSCQHISEITVFSASLILAGLFLIGICLLRQIVGVLHFAGIDVADGDDLDGGHFEKVSQMARGHSASADDTDRNAVVGRRGQNFGHGNEGRRSGGGSESFQE